jgi:cbb3-type cytochrome oxidase maturation protein
MDILYTLIPLSVALIFVVIVVLGWAIFNGQFEDLGVEASRILSDDDVAASGPLDLNQEAPAGPASASALSSRRPR